MMYSKLGLAVAKILDKYGIDYKDAPDVIEDALKEWYQRGGQ